MQAGAERPRDGEAKSLINISHSDAAPPVGIFPLHRTAPLKCTRVHSKPPGELGQCTFGLQVQAISIYPTVHRATSYSWGMDSFKS